MSIIRHATPQDWPALWAVIEPVIRAGEAYALDPAMTEGEARATWLGPDRETFVAEYGSEILGTYYLRANQPGGGAHVANCGYATAEAARGKGVARAMCEHSLMHAKARGFTAMQFNFVVSTNESAVRLWRAMGFDVVGTLPGAFRHPKLGFVDALVMNRAL